MRVHVIVCGSMYKSVCGAMSDPKHNPHLCVIQDTDYYDKTMEVMRGRLGFPTGAQMMAVRGIHTNYHPGWCKGGRYGRCPNAIIPCYIDPETGGCPPHDCVCPIPVANLPPPPPPPKNETSDNEVEEDDEETKH